MKAKKIIKFSLISVLFLALAAYIAYAITSMKDADGDKACIGLVLKIKENDKANFVNKAIIEEMLKNARLYPVGRMMKDINTESIESTLQSNNFIRNVECYKSSDANLCIEIEQRTPVMYILPDNASGYFVDEDGKIIPNTNYTSNIIVATGNIDTNYATSKLAQLGKFIQSDTFWDSQLEQIHVTTNKERKRVIELIPRVGQQTIYMGSADNYEDKLLRLRAFYKKAMGVVGWNKYEKLNLEYNNQIICTKHKQ